MHIEGITVGPRSHPAFREPLRLEFDKRVNLFAGPNASGKTSLLRVLVYSGLVDKTAIFPFPADEVRLSSDWEAMFGARDGFDDAALWGVPWIYIPATRLILPAELDWNDGVQAEDGVEDEIDDVNWQDSARVFDGRWVERVCKVLYDKFKGQLNEGQRDFYGLLQALRTAYSCTKSVSNEILVGSPSNYVSHPYELLADPEDFEPLFDEPYVHPGMGVSAKYGESSKSLHQYVGDLSAGTQGTFLWVLYIALKIWRFYQQPDIPKINEGKWQERPAILLIDEIENHLHPTWQRRVIPALLEHFSGLQIFATTHSPFVVAGLKAGQVHLLKRDGNGVVTSTTNTEDIIGWTADEILRTMMGVNDPTDEATAAAAHELRQLRQEPPRSTPEQEEQRQRRIEELREQVDRDLLAGGPIARQREIFEERFAKVLQRYRQSQDLNEEGG